MRNAGDDVITSITSDVLRVLSTHGFFARLDDLMSPTDETRLPERCVGSYSLSERLLREDGFDDDEVSDVLKVLYAQGGCCDCEILYNVSEENRLKAIYWEKMAASLDKTTSPNQVMPEIHQG